MDTAYLAVESGHRLAENAYRMDAEGTLGALLTTGNGYIGVRGSLEEFGSVRVQGCYIRGVIDRIYELPQPFADNIYMKKYYLNEDGLKTFETQDSIINLIDFLLVRVTIRGEVFYPWEATLHRWKRYLDMEKGCLVREVEWENTAGDRTLLRYERFSSFDDDHLYAMSVTVTPQNHAAPMEILSGMDLRTKTNGQHTTVDLESIVENGCLFHTNQAGKAYGFTCCTGVANRLYADDTELPIQAALVEKDGLFAQRFTLEEAQAKSYRLEKKIVIYTARDTQQNVRQQTAAALLQSAEVPYCELFLRHQTAWGSFFAKMDVQIKGDMFADASVRFANYHTAISLPRNDAVHSLGAKGLTGETYNDFVWWDCEIYQAPVFFHTVPGQAGNIIRYRYRLLDAARQNARDEGHRGARFPFTSSVTGKETVWQYARHPFLQIHVVADVAWAVLRYFEITGDRALLLECGLEILWEVARYWSDRVSETQAGFSIQNVTGPDEHHPYVDNDAFTNYLVGYVLEQAAALSVAFAADASAICQRIGLLPAEVDRWRAIAKQLYRPMDKNTGMIPQFDGYFSLARELETAGGTAAQAFQMKQSGLYHKSQVIKQPDVMLLFSYLDLPFDKAVYRRNWNYYEARCEASSSLSYPVHAICAADMEQPESAYQYLLKTARLDLEDRHHCAWQGVHAACLAGAWLAVARGIMGVVTHSTHIEIHPHMLPWWEEVRLNVLWHGQHLSIALSNTSLTLQAAEDNTGELPLVVRGEEHKLCKGQGLVVELGGYQPPMSKDSEQHGGNVR